MDVSCNYWKKKKIWWIPKHVMSYMKPSKFRNFQAYRGPNPSLTKRKEISPFTPQLPACHHDSWRLGTIHCMCAYMKMSILNIQQQNEFADKWRKQDIWGSNIVFRLLWLLILCNHNSDNGRRRWLMIIQLKYPSMKQCSSPTFSCPCYESPLTHAHCSCSGCWSYRSSLLFDQVFPLCKQRYTHFLPLEPT